MIKNIGSALLAASLVIGSCAQAHNCQSVTARGIFTACAATCGGAIGNIIAANATRGSLTRVVLTAVGAGLGGAFGWLFTIPQTPQAAFNHAEQLIAEVQKHAACSKKAHEFVFQMRDKYFNTKWPLGRAQHECNRLNKKLIRAQEDIRYAMQGNCALQSQFQPMAIQLALESGMSPAQALLGYITALSVQLDAISRYMHHEFGDEYTLQCKHFDEYWKSEKAERKARKDKKCC